MTLYDGLQTRHPDGAALLKWMKEESGGGYLTTQEVLSASLDFTLAMANIAALCVDTCKDEMASTTCGAGG